jgi:preprotein translocase subunit SecA
MLAMEQRPLTDDAFAAALDEPHLELVPAQEDDEHEAEAEAAPAALRAKGLDQPQQSAALTYSGPNDGGSGGGASGAKKAAASGTVTATKEPGRNDPCPCGSGKKYKQCHGRPTGAV